MTDKQPMLAGVRVIECSLLGPAAITSHLVDLGAEVIKVESPAGDYGRKMTWPIMEGTSLLHLHVNRGKQSLVLNLKQPDAIAVFEDLVRGADVVVEAMRPGFLAKMGLGYDRLEEINPKIVMCTISGYGATGPYRDLPSHGIAYDAWSGTIQPFVRYTFGSNCTATILGSTCTTMPRSQPRTRSSSSLSWSHITSTMSPTL